MEQKSNRVDTLLSLTRKTVSLDQGSIARISRMPELVFKALCEFLAKHREKNGLILNSRSRKLVRLIEWVDENSTQDEAVIEALNKVTDATIIAILADQDGNPFKRLRDSLDHNLKLHVRERIKNRTKPNQGMQITKTASWWGDHYRKMG